MKMIAATLLLYLMAISTFAVEAKSGSGSCSVSIITEESNALGYNRSYTRVYGREYNRTYAQPNSASCEVHIDLS